MCGGLWCWWWLGLRRRLHSWLWHGQWLTRAATITILRPLILIAVLTLGSGIVGQNWQAVATVYGQ
jgi:hypothetical protein